MINKYCSAYAITCLQDKMLMDDYSRYRLNALIISLSTCILNPKLLRRTHNFQKSLPMHKQMAKFSLLHETSRTVVLS